MTGNLNSDKGGVNVALLWRGLMESAGGGEERWWHSFACQDREKLEELS
jgi:hypothetical protein